MTFILEPFVNELSKHGGFPLVENLDLDFEYGRNPIHVENFVKLFNPEKLRVLNVKESYLEIYKYMNEAGFTCIQELDVKLPCMSQI